LTPTFVSVLPFLLEMFDLTDFNKRHKTASLKAQYINFNASLKLTKLQMDDRDRASKVLSSHWLVFLIETLNLNETHPGDR
jgi:hypothetical protein